MSDALKLGFGDPVAISAETGEGMADLYDVLQPHIDAQLAGTICQDGLGQLMGMQEDAENKGTEQQIVKVAIMGLPNVVSSLCWRVMQPVVHMIVFDT